MVIVVDLVGDDEDVVDSEDAKAAMVAHQEEERIRREAYLEWVQHNEQVEPQVVPITQR